MLLVSIPDFSLSHVVVFKCYPAINVSIFALQPWKNCSSKAEDSLNPPLSCCCV